MNIKTECKSRQCGTPFINRGMHRKIRYMTVLMSLLLLVYSAAGWGFITVSEPSSNANIGYVSDQLHFKVRLKLLNTGSTAQDFKWECNAHNVSLVRAGIALEVTENTWFSLRGNLLYQFPTEINFKPMNTATPTYSFALKNHNKLQSFYLNVDGLLRLPLMPRRFPVRLKMMLGIGVGAGYLHFMEEMLDESTPFFYIYPIGGAEVLLFNRISITNEYSYNWGMSITEKGKQNFSISSGKWELRYFIENFRIFWGVNIYFRYIS